MSAELHGYNMSHLRSFYKAKIIIAFLFVQSLASLELTQNNS